MQRLKCCFEYTKFKDDLIEYKCVCCNKNFRKKFDENLKKWLVNTHKSNHDINNFILFLQKSVFPYKYMDDWGKFNESKKIFTVI